MLDLEDRILMNDGVSVITDDKAVEILLNDGTLQEHFKVIPSKDSKKFQMKYQVDIEYDTEEGEIAPDKTYESHDFEDLVNALFENPRDDTDEELHLYNDRRKRRVEETYNEMYFLIA